MQGMAASPRKSRSGARRAAGSTPQSAARAAPVLSLRRLRRLLLRGLAVAGCALLLLIVLLRFVNPVWTPYMISERLRLGQLERDWVSFDEIAPVMARSVVAAEDANFCLHWGFDMSAIRKALDEGANRGASTISQQVVKNVFLWQGRSWPRKAAEAILTPVIETLWPKRRILEIYLNVAETGKGVFGVQAAARRAFGVDAADLNPQQAARIATVLPNPRERNPANLSGSLVRRSQRVADGAATIRADGRAACFSQ